MNTLSKLHSAHDILLHLIQWSGKMSRTLLVSSFLFRLHDTLYNPLKSGAAAQSAHCTSRCRAINISFLFSPKLIENRRKTVNNTEWNSKNLQEFCRSCICSQFQVKVSIDSICYLIVVQIQIVHYNQFTTSNLKQINNLFWCSVRFIYFTTFSQTQQKIIDIYCQWVILDCLWFAAGLFVWL